MWFLNDSKQEIVDLLLTEYHSYIGKENMYMGFKSACSLVGEKVIPILMKNSVLRSVVLKREVNNVTEQSGMTCIRTQFKRIGKSQEYEISFDEKKVPLEVDISPVRTVSEINDDFEEDYKTKSPDYHSSQGREQIWNFKHNS